MTMSTRKVGLSADVKMERDGIVIFGSFRLPVDDNFGQPDHTALVMTVSYRTGHKVVRPFKDKIFFVDDLMVFDRSVTGNFEIDFREYLVEGIRKYNVLLSIRDHLSPVLEVKISE